MLQTHKHLTNCAINYFHTFAYRKNELVYVPTLKSACTYYYTLCYANGFERIDFNKIDWDTDHVFGFIMDPVKRYFKGLVEDLILSENPELLETVYDLLGSFSKFGFPISSHCLPITTTLSDRAYEIDWIPLYNQDIPSHELFLKLCQHHGISINDKDPTIDSHVSNQHKLDLFDRFYQYADKFDDLRAPAWYMTLVEDIELYYNVVAKINSTGRTWTEISWLSNTNNVKPRLEGHGFPSKVHCHCKKCQQGTKRETETIYIGDKTFIVPTEWTDLNKCPDCDNKNCPKADFHDNQCIYQGS